MSQILSISRIWFEQCFCLRRKKAAKEETVPRQQSVPCSSPVPQQTTSIERLAFNDHQNHIRELLGTHLPTSSDVSQALRELKWQFPVPPTMIVPEDVWGVPYLHVTTHLRAEYAEAVANIKRSGHQALSAPDETYLQLLLTHPCGWSATYANHIHDSWVRYLQAEYKHISGMVPILDSLFLLEEVEHLPEGLHPSQSTLFLLATADTYLVYHFADGALHVAGETLKEVYEGLKDYRFQGDKDSDWEEEPRALGRDQYRYFPVYSYSREGMFDLQYPLENFAVEVS